MMLLETQFKISFQRCTIKPSNLYQERNYQGNSFDIFTKNSSSQDTMTHKSLLQAASLPPKDQCVCYHLAASPEIYYTT